MFSRLARSFAFLLFLGFSPLNLAISEEPLWPITGPAFSAMAAEMQTAAAKVPAEPFAGATVFFERDHYSIDASGRKTFTHLIVYRLETQEGVDQLSEMRMPWAPWYQNPPEFRARVIGSDGKVSTLDPKTVTDGPAKEDTQDTYTDARVRKAPVPGAAVGAIIECEIQLSDKEPFFAGGEVYWDGFARNNPVLRAEILIDVPESTNFQYKLQNMPKAEIKNEVTNGIRHFTVEQGYVPAYVESDVRLVRRETHAPIVSFSTGASWEAVAKTYRQLAEPNIEPDKVKSLLPAKLGSDRMAAIMKIVAKLHKEVRYTGIEFGEASLKPTSAAEVLKRHYGDCKDKAALLVAMLRAAGIPADMALLQTGPGFDIEKDLPGMNLFDHAIVYVPATGKGGDSLWIDATAEYFEVGTLPAMDRGRLALIVADETTGLKETPAANPEDDKVTELRDVAMAEYGGANITETSMTHGDSDANYRSFYGEELTREKREAIENYAKNVYKAKALGAVTHGDAHDLTQPFALKLVMTEAKRANTVIDDAVVGVPYGDIFSRLPEWFRTDPRVDGEKLTPQEKENLKRAVAARVSQYDVHPFVTEWRYTITPAEGFKLRVLPENKTTQMGPAKLTQHYEVDPQGVIKATLQFDTGKPGYTVDEVLALRDAVLGSYKQDMIAIWFDQVGAGLLAEGKIRAALAADRALIEKRPNDSLHHSQMAFVYLKAGLGDLARKEAEQAIKLDEKSPVGYRTLGWMCEFNEIGLQFARGFDWDCAANALKKALALEPDDTNTAVSLGFLNEYDKDGERYSPKATLSDAVAYFRAVKEKEKSVGEQYDDNVFFDLFYGGREKELLDELGKVSMTTARRALAVAANVAEVGGEKGVTAGIDRADHLSGGTEERNAALRTAGYELVRLRIYPEAAGIFSAAVEGQQNASDIAQKIDLYKKLTQWKGEFLPATDPRSPVQQLLVAEISGSYSDAIAARYLTRQAFSSDEDWRRTIESTVRESGWYRPRANRTGESATALLDQLVGTIKLTDEGDDESGHRITCQREGSRPSHYFVIKQDGAYKVVTSGGRFSETGNEVLYLLKSGREKEARALLDWLRGMTHKGGGDDPLSGPSFPHFWTAGDKGDAAAMRLAAGSLLSWNDGISEQLPTLRSEWETATGERKLNLAIVLANGYMYLQDGVHLKEMAAGIMKDYPDSNVALTLAGNADTLLKDWDDLKKMFDGQIAKHPEDESVLRLESSFLEEKCDWAGSRAALQKIFDLGKATAEDYNSYAWTGLFDGKVDDDTLKQARQADMMTNNWNFSILHTLASLYAYQGKTTEARDALLKAMAADSETKPSPDVWFVFGSIYEKYGLNDAATEAYAKVEKPLGRISPQSTYALAQTRLKVLAAAAN